MISIDQLFNEDFKPQLMLAKERRIKESLDHYILADVEFKYRELARKSRQHISAKYPPKKTYNVN